MAIKKKNVPSQFTIEDAKLMYRNFAGLVRGRFDVQGERYFNVILDEETARVMEADGWNVKWKRPWEEGDPPLPLLKIHVKYRARDGRTLRPPRIMLISGRGKTVLDEGTISILDWADIESADMSVNPYEYERDGETRYSAYLRSLYATIRDDPLEMKYMDVPDSALSAIVSDPEDEL